MDKIHSLFGFAGSYPAFSGFPSYHSHVAKIQKSPIPSKYFPENFQNPLNESPSFKRLTICTIYSRNACFHSPGKRAKKGRSTKSVGRRGEEEV